jgi:hypothetical protein
VNYLEDDRFNQFVFEDSYVLGVIETESSITFQLDLVLTPQHPDYAPPPPSRAYCFRRADLVFEGVARRSWVQRKFHPYTDANDEVDYGNIDSFEIDDGCYHLDGGWGEVKIFADRAYIALRDRAK